MNIRIILQIMALGVIMMLASSFALAATYQSNFDNDPEKIAEHGHQWCFGIYEENCEYGSAQVSAHELKNKKIFRVVVKNTNGSFEKDPKSDVVKAHYYLAKDEKELQEKTYKNTAPKNLFITDVTNQFSFTDEECPRCQRTAQTKLTFDDYENRLVKNYTSNRFPNYLEKIPEDYDIIAIGNRFSCKELFCIKKGTDLHDLFLDQFTQTELTEALPITHLFSKDGFHIGYQRLFTQEKNGTNKLFRSRYASEDDGNDTEKPISIDATKDKLISVQQYNGNDYYIVPKNADLTTTFAGILSKGELTNAKDITADYSAQGYKKEPNYSHDLDNVTQNKNTGTYWYGDVELTTIPKDAIIAKIEKGANAIQYSISTKKIQNDPKEEKKTITSNNPFITAGLGSIITLGFLKYAHIQELKKTHKKKKKPISFKTFIAHVARHPGDYPAITIAFSLTLAGTIFCCVAPT